MKLWIAIILTLLLFVGLLFVCIPKKKKVEPTYTVLNAVSLATLDAGAVVYVANCVNDKFADKDVSNYPPRIIIMGK
jgi:hypothetical protein